jgi:hypothetical protein
MKTKLLFTILIAFIGFTANAQCHYIPSTSTATETLSYSFSGGSFQSYGCAPIDPTRWLSGSGNSVTVTFVNPESYPTFRVWGMNDDDVVSVSVNSVSYPLTSSSASYDTKVVCGISPGPDGVIFSEGNLVVANSNAQGNYSYQNVQLTAINVTSITITGISGAGWGFAGVSVNCTLGTGISQLTYNEQQVLIYPNPFNYSATIQFNSTLVNAELNIYNLYGQKIKTINNISGDKIKIDRENLSSGIYFIHLTQDNKTITKDKLVITD